MADDDRNAYALARVRANMGDLFIAAEYPGGARALYNDVLKAEAQCDRQSERMSFAVRVLQGHEDVAVHAWSRADLLEGDGILCDHCQDLSARMLRAARDRARSDFERVNRQLVKLLATVREGLHACSFRLEGGDPYDPEVLEQRLGAFFKLFGARARAAEADRG